MIAHDDLTRPALPRRIMIPIIMDVLNKAGIKDEDVFLLSAGGNHCKWPDTSLRAYFGEEIYNRFRPLGSASRLLNHDCHDPQGLNYMGVSELGIMSSIIVSWTKRRSLSIAGRCSHPIGEG